MRISVGKLFQTEGTWNVQSLIGDCRNMSFTLKELGRLWRVMKDQEVSLGYVKFKMPTRHPSRSFEQAGACMGPEFKGEVYLAGRQIFGSGWHRDGP